MSTLPSKNNAEKTLYALSLAWQLGFLIAVPLGGFLLLGYWIDTVLQTKPLVLLIGLALGGIVTCYELYHVLTPFIKKDPSHHAHD